MANEPKFKIMRKDTLNIFVREQNQYGEYDSCGSMGKKEKLNGKIANEMSDDELLAHFESNKREWGYR